MVNLTREEIQAAVASVPDPEIPVLSLGDLGIVRGVEMQCDKPLITISPTYSGCPAIRLIEEMIGEKLRSMGVESFEIIRSISPPWSSDWISEHGRAKLQAYGIAPPNQEAGERPKACPRCACEHVTKISEFASTPCQAMWRCDDCLEVFNYFKCMDSIHHMYRSGHVESITDGDGV